MLLADDEVGESHLTCPVHNPGRQGMKGQCFDTRALRIFGQFLTQASAGFTREGRGEDAARANFPMVDEVPNTSNQGRRFSTSGNGEYEGMPFPVFHDALLFDRPFHSPDSKAFPDNKFRQTKPLLLSV
ncbi:hypothetical protein GCM10010914_05250 [Deinococcus wulumuqiensis]|uniref:Uncharacterized protein n=1 Tax=Deinococcus wulumuqiensis TaxID=980427 RepID=A0AAV4K1W4_9DEIO|nr:hypothetical protein GCM10010914_05250 [Deinococcus wulumuqiensis]GGP29838.1 hypothetical protein GCM10008021_14890 [Deinococcus wulumuqiensis]